MTYFDTHCHLNSDRFALDLDDTISRAKKAGVKQMMTIGISLKSSQQCQAIAAANENVYAAIGIQPNCAHEAEVGDWDSIVALLDSPGVVAIGETGLDRYWKDCPFDIQEDYFDRHLKLSQHRNVPFVVHMRECGDDVLRMLTEARQRGPLRGVMHSFTGDLQLMRACVDLGMYISFAGMVTFKNSTDLRSVAVDVPNDRLLIETDAPYLSPEPMRKQRRNEPSLVVHTAKCLADARGCSLEEIAHTTTFNAHRFLGLG